MKILLLGHKGYLGSFLYSNLDVDILYERNIYTNGNTYDYVINCIGVPDLKKCENDPETTGYSNRDILFDIKKFYPQSKIINFSSYYVYNSNKICSETSPITYDNIYAKQKLEAEQINIEGVNFRIGKLFGHPNINKQHKLTEYILNNSNIRVDNIKFNPTSLSQILEVIKYELTKNHLKGIYNLSNKGLTTHYEYASFINQQLGNNKTIQLVNPYYSFSNYGKFSMSCSKLEKFIKLRSWEQDMTDYINLIKPNL